MRSSNYTRTSYLMALFAERYNSVSENERAPNAVIGECGGFFSPVPGAFPPKGSSVGRALSEFTNTCP